MLVGVGDTPVMLFFKIVVGKVGVAAAPQPELLDKLLAFLVRIELEKGVPLFRRNDVDDVLIQPLLVLVVEFFKSLARFLLLSLLLLFGERLRRRRILRILSLLGL